MLSVFSRGVDVLPEGAAACANGRLPSQGLVGSSPRPPGPERRNVLGLAGVLFLGAALRLAYLLELWQSPLFLLNLLRGLDMATYYAEALAFADGRVLDPRTPFFQAPLYPLFLGGVLRLAPPSVALLTVAQVLLGVSACALLYALSHRLASPAVGLLAAGLYAVYPLGWYYGGLLLTENLLVVLLLAMALAATHALETGHVRAWLAVGVLCGLGTLTKPNVAVVLPALGAAAWFVARRAAMPIGGAHLASGPRLAVLVGVVAFGLVILPAVVFNSLAAGSLQFVSGQGSHLWLSGNTAYATGLYQLPCGDAWLPWSPDLWLMQGRKLILFFSNAEFGNNTSFEVFRAHLALLPPLSVGGFGPLSALGILGIVLPPAGQRGRWLGPMLVLGLYVVSISAFVVIGRYRLPAAALLCLPAASVALRLPALARHAPRRLVLAAAGVAALTLAANVGLPAVDVSVPFAHANAASVYAEAGDQATAEAEQALARASRRQIEAQDTHACSQLPPF